MRKRYYLYLANKNIDSKIVRPLCFIVNKSFLTGQFPDNAKIAKLVSILKAGDRSDYRNYRPISLLPCNSKIFEKLMLIRVLKFLDNNAPFNKHQRSFQPVHSTVSTMIVFNNVSIALDNIEQALVLFIDVAKAFNFNRLSYSVL